MSKQVTLTIDGQTVSVPEGTLIVDAAKKIGIDIIKQEKKWFEKHPLLEERIKSLEEDLDDLYKKVK